ncbi:MAG: hypothetical protein WAT70_02930, partial [Rhizobiaceae bacterium]
MSRFWWEFSAPQSNEAKETKITTTLIAPEGIEFGNGAIGVKNRLADPEDPLKPEDMQNVHEFLTSPEALVDVSIDKETGTIVDDDGCGDGRVVAQVLIGDVAKKKSLIRPKVFGGAPVMALAAKIGNNEAVNV